MNYMKAQKEIFDRLSHGDRVCYFPVGKEKIFVTPDGFKGYVLPLDIVAFNCEKLQQMKALELDSICTPENELTLTNDAKLLRIGSRKEFCICMKGAKKRVFIRTKFLDAFQNPKFYQKLGEKLGAVVVTERNTREVKEHPVGVVLPVRGPELDEEEENENA